MVILEGGRDLVGLVKVANIYIDAYFIALVIFFSHLVEPLESSTWLVINVQVHGCIYIAVTGI